MPYGRQQINHRTRRRNYAATAVLSLALWLFMAAAENWTPLHAWLHGGAIPDGDDCAIVLLTHGKIESPAANVPVIAPAVLIEAAPTVEFLVDCPTIENLPPGRAPPAPCTAS